MPGTGSQYYYHADGEGSIRLLTDANGQIANRYDYDSYGQRLSVIESLPLQPYGWKGREWIPGPNIYYNRARFYDPVLGRFMSQDPLGYGEAIPISTASPGIIRGTGAIPAGLTRFPTVASRRRRCKPRRRKPGSAAR